MNLFSAILKLVRMYNLTSDSEEYQTLHNDVKKWELEVATKDSTDNIGKLYYRLHQSILFRLAMPFIFFFAASEVKKLMSADANEGDDF